MARRISRSRILCEPPASSQVGYWFWSLLFLAVAVFEIWAATTKHRTLTQVVRHGPRWFKWAIGVGLAGLLVHLFLF